MTTRQVLHDFTLHIGPNGAGESCALLRMVGDQWIEPGYVVARVAEDGAEIEIVTYGQRIALCPVPERHYSLIREQGLYVIQRASPQHQPESLLLEFREC